MATIRIQPFSGLVPRKSANLLENGQAQTALNAKLYSGEIRPWKQPLKISTTLCSSATTVYRLTDNSTERWLSWPQVVNVAPSQIADFTDRRIYYTTPSDIPKKTNLALASTGAGPWPAAWRDMGVTGPTAAPTLAKIDGAGVSETRAYVYTNVSTFGAVLEESAPSLPTSVSLLPTGGTVNVSGFTVAPLFSTITPGSGYTNGTYAGVTTTLSSGTAPTVYPKVTVTVAGGVVTAVTVDAPGSGYGATTALTVPAASIGGTGSGFSVVVGQNITSRRIYRSVTDTYLLVADVPINESQVTITNAAPAVVTWTAHGFSAGQPVFFRTTGALPTGLTAGTIYFVIAAGLTANSFEVSATVGGAAINTSTAGSGVNTGSTAYSDTIAAASLPGDALNSLAWLPPPVNLQGLVNMPNGMMAGFVGNQVYFCEPYYPHAWPIAYALSVEYQIVGLGVFGSSLVVCTQGKPYIISGIHPSSMSQEKQPLLEPCMSLRSITQDQYGVLYASPNGLVAIGPGVADVITKPLYNRTDWQVLDPSTMIATMYAGNYISLYGSAGKAIVFSRDDVPALAELLLNFANLYVDQMTAKMYGVSTIDGFLYQFDADPDNNQSYEWKSPRYVIAQPSAFTCFQVAADYSNIADTNAIIASNAAKAAANAALLAAGNLGGVLNGAALNVYAVNGSILATLASSVAARSVTVTLYADNTQILSTPVTSIEPIRIPPVRAYTWEIAISGTIAARSFFMATSVAELRMG
jgi:hypothetical protein